MDHIDLGDDERRGKCDERHLYPERSSPAQGISDRTTDDGASSCPRAEEDVDTALIEPSICYRDQIGDDDSLVVRSG